MDISKYISAAQAAELQAVSKSVKDIKNTKLKGFQLDASSFSLDPAICRLVF